MACPVRNDLLAQISTALTSCSTAELQNILRMVVRGTLNPDTSVLTGLSHYPRPAHADRLSKILNDGMTAISKTRLEAMPVLADTIVDELLANISACAKCEGLLQQQDIDLVVASANMWKTRVSDANESEQEMRNSWLVMGHFARIGALIGFIQGDIFSRLHVGGSHSPNAHSPKAQDTLQLFRTDSAHQANAIIYASYYPTHMIRREHPDWMRMKNSHCVRVQGALVAGDTDPEELLYDIACRLGMPTEADTEFQIKWMQRRMDSLVWVTKLIRQGCFASLMFVVGTALFGVRYPMTLTGGAAPECGHKLEIDVSANQLVVKASVRFAIRDAEMAVAGELPLCIHVRSKMDADGTIGLFQMVAEVQLKKCPVDWEALRMRVQPLLI
eukprot:TRINITY_DN61550_c0_g1_i1.p1 TRINITY_DN61550_c0_g1~~TRINITY_DN61550_c0_g1_i1.p1  ORF type:complete len:387 (+),score=41.68 TRINITY_DN61550_c0_g1_i1:56-1216(+)